jgi:septum formation protein
VTEPPPLVLASASPRRRDLLRRAGVAFEIRPADLDETPSPGESPAATLARLAREKARAVAAAIGAPRRIVLGADTGVVLGDTLFGKPTDADDAIRLLSQLVGRTHEVITAVAVTESVGGRVWECAVTSRVTMREAEREELAAYVASGEPMDKAGAYAYQGEGRRFVIAVEGSETNVIGLPMDETIALFSRVRDEALPA